MSSQAEAPGEQLRDGAGGRGSGGALAGHDPALLPRGRIPGRRMPGQIRPVRFLWSEVEAAWDSPTRPPWRGEWTIARRRAA